MRARIQESVTRQTVKIWLWEPLDGRLRFFYPSASPSGGSLWSGEYYPEGVMYDDVRPSLELPQRALEAIVREAGDSFHPGDATVDALKDSRAVRDRLLSIVETSTGARASASSD